MRKILLWLLAAMFLLQGNTVLAAEGGGGDIREAIDSQLEQYELDKYDLAIQSAIGEVEGMEGQPFSEILYQILTGTLPLSAGQVVKLLAGQIFSEIYDNLAIMRNLIIIAIFGAVLKSVNSSYFSKSVSELGDYIVYILLIALIAGSFSQAATIAAEAISRMAGFMQALIPLIMGLLMASGRYAISFVFHPATMLVVQVATTAIKGVVVPLIAFAGAIQMVNFLLPEGTLDKLSELMGKGIGKGLKWTAILFVGVMSLRTAAAPIAGGIISKGAHLAVSSVPVVGQIFSEAVDSVFYWGSALKNGVAVTAILFVAFLCFMPVLKLAVITLIYKLAAALIEPLVEERFSDCISAAGTYITLFIGAIACVAVMFTVLLMMVVAGAMG